MLLNNQQITEEVKICIETNENENTTTQNLCNTVIAVLRLLLGLETNLAASLQTPQEA